MALLRSINVAGHGKLKMDDLRGGVAALGYTDVATYIQSGNVVFTSTEPVDGATLEQQLAVELGIDTNVVLRSGPELAAVLEHNPFPAAEPSTLHVGFAAEPAALDSTEGLDLERFNPERAEIAGDHVYFQLPSGMGRAKLPPYLARRLPAPITVRNWNTVTKLAQLAG